MTYHAWPGLVPGGFIGVDVFFAVSGFLITGLLLRELEETGRVSLSAFWARRARRLLPAAMVVLLFCVAATLAFVPVTLWAQYLGDVRASTLYVQNWHLASAAVDYFAAANDPSPVQHFWSLSAEEQFYVIWPVAIVFAIAICRHRSVRVTRRVIGGVLVLMTATSLAYGWQETASSPAFAYFATPTRGWEFAVGGLLAFAPWCTRLPAWAGASLSWLGIAGIAVAAASYNNATAIPGTAAVLPVAATLAVIAAGRPAVGWGATRALAVRPVQYLGDISYSAYLWHWPLLVLVPFGLGVGAHAPERVAIVLVTLAAAAVTKVAIEDPIRHGTMLAARRSIWTLATAAGAAAFVLGAAASGTAHLEARALHDARAARAILRAAPDCFAAAAHDPLHRCRNPALRLAVTPSPVLAAHAHPAPCTWLDSLVCLFGVPARDAVATVALVGDSHAGHWRAALDAIAHRRRWQGVSLTMTGCLFSTARKAFPEPRRTWCRRWKQDVLGWLRAHPAVGTIFVSQIAGEERLLTNGHDKFEVAVRGFAQMWRALPRSVRRIVVIRDTPKVHRDTAACVERALENRRPAGLECAVHRRTALAADPAVIAAARMRSARVRSVDLTRYICDGARCLPVIGGALVFTDETHLTQTFSRSLAPYLERELRKLAIADTGTGTGTGSAVPLHARVSARSALGCHHANRPGIIDMAGAGTIDVRLVDGRPRPERPRPALGWTASVWHRDTRVRATFRHKGASVRLRAHLRPDGLLVALICRR